jgi:preprotein translocase subunit SecD
VQTIKTTLIVAAAAFVFAGCALFGRREQTTLRFHEQVSSALPETRVRTVELPQLGMRVTISPFPTLSENDIKSAELMPTAGGSAVMLHFDMHGESVLDEMTTRLRGQYVVIYLDADPVAAWLVDRRITDGRFLLEGSFNDEQAKQLVDDLNRMSKKRR